MNKIYTLLVFLFVSTYVFSQGTCATAIDMGTPTTTSSCQTWTTSSGTSGSTSCAGSGWGGPSFNIRYVQFCTDASNSCVNFDLTSTGGWAGNVNFTLYTAGCGAGVAVGAVQQCQTGLVAGGTIAFAPTNNGGTVVTTASTCYVLRIALDAAPTAANPIQMCVYTQAPAVNNVCTGAMTIDAVPESTNNDPACSFSAGPTTNTPALTPGSFCAGSLENTAWYTFTVLADGNVVVTIDGITCVGGGSGFQIGYFTGSCGSLTNIGCSSGSGGSVTATITGLTAGQIITIGIDGNAGAFCTFNISATNTVLPITLLSYTASYSDNKVNLDWITETEINNDFFTVERSIDGVKFETVSIVKGAGNSNNRTAYSSLDLNPIKGTSYYRLKQTDYDGQYSYSNIEAVKIQSTYDDVTVYPNPVTGNGYLTFSSLKDDEQTLVIYDVSGRIVYQKQYAITTGNNKLTLETINLTKGMYFIKLDNAEDGINFKFIKE